MFEIKIIVFTLLSYFVLKFVYRFRSVIFTILKFIFYLPIKGFKGSMEHVFAEQISMQDQNIKSVYKLDLWDFNGTIQEGNMIVMNGMLEDIPEESRSKLDSLIKSVLFYVDTKLKGEHIDQTLVFRLRGGSDEGGNDLSDTPEDDPDYLYKDYNDEYEKKITKAIDSLFKQEVSSNV